MRSWRWWTIRSARCVARRATRNTTIERRKCRRRGRRSRRPVPLRCHRPVWSSFRPRLRSLLPRLMDRPIAKPDRARPNLPLKLASDSLRLRRLLMALFIASSSGRRCRGSRARCPSGGFPSSRCTTPAAGAPAGTASRFGPGMAGHIGRAVAVASASPHRATGGPAALVKGADSLRRVADPARAARKGAGRIARPGMRSAAVPPAARSPDARINERPIR